MKDTCLEIGLVINTRYGGFSLSDEAQLEIAKRKGLQLFRDEYGSLKIKGEGHRWLRYELARNDPDLIAVVKSLRERPGGQDSPLKVVTLKISVDIDQFDGMETGVTVYGDTINWGEHA
jgi:hypothetical protein